MSSETDSTGKHLRRMPAPKLKGKTVPLTGKVGVALYSGSYIKLGKVTAEIAERLGATVWCANIEGKQVLGRVAVDRQDGCLSVSNTNAEDWAGARFVPL